MAQELKREFHYFVLTDYEQEEDYLRQMHRNGWKLVKVKLPGFFYFEACQPEDVVYKIDFNPQMDREWQDYLQMYQDYGWEYLQDINNYSYFRKSASEGMDEQELEIFSDSASKLEMLRRIFVKRMIPIFCIFLCCMLPQFLRATANQPGDGFELGLSIFIAVLFVLYILVIGRCAVGFWRLKRKYNGEG